MSYYRHSWINRATGYQCRLDIVPYDQNIGGTETVLPVFTISGDPDMIQEQGFDELPLGMMTVGGIEISVIIDNVPSTLRTRLKDGTDATGDKRNTFIFWTDRGTGGVTWTVEGVYVQTDIESTKYTTVAGLTVCTYALQDALSWTMQRMTGKQMFHDGSYKAPESSRRWSELQQTNATDLPVTNQSFLVDRGGASYVCLSSWQHIADHISDSVSSWFNTWVNRSGSVLAGYVNSVGQAPFQDLLVGALTMFRPVEDGTARVAGDELTVDELLFVTHIYDDDGNMIGGLYHENDELSLARYESTWDACRELSEQGFVKVSWRYVYNDDVTNPYISVSMRVRRPLAQSRRVGGITEGEATKTLTRIGDEEVTDGSSVIGKSEVRGKTFRDKDITEVVVNNGTTRGQRSFNAPCVVWTAPVWMDKARRDRHGRDYLEFNQHGFTQTNMVFCVDGSGNQRVKVHETIRFGWSQGATDHFEFSSVESEQPPLIANGTGNAGNAEQSELAIMQFEAWCNTLQSSTGTMAGLANSALQLFASRNQASFDLTMPITSAEGLTEFLGYVFSVDAHATLDHITWSQAVCTNIKVDWKKGTITYSLLCIPDPA